MYFLSFRTSFFLSSHYKLLDDKPDIEKVVLLLYANTLHKFYNMSAGDLRNKNLLTLIHPTSRPVAMRVLSDFTVLTKSGRYVFFILNINLNNAVFLSYASA